MTKENNDQPTSDCNSAATDVRQCLTCRYWEGNKELARKLIKETDGRCMDLHNVWVGDGPCAVGYLWQDITIYGNAVADLSVGASFGCVYWEA